MKLRKIAFLTGWLAVVAFIVPAAVQAMTPVDAVRFQVEHEYAAGRMVPQMRDDLVSLLEDVKAAAETGNTAAYRLRVDTFRIKLENSQSNEIDQEAAERILSVARSLQ